MSDRTITVSFLGNARDLNAAADSSERRMSSWGSKLKTVGKVAALGLAAGAVLAGKALWDSAKAAAEDQAAQVRLATTLKKTTGATDEQIAKVEDWIAAQGRALGVTDDDLRPAMQRLTEATHDVGEAQKLASIAMDVSAGTGKSLKSVSEALMKAHNGNIGALGRLGIKTKDAEGNTLSFKDAVKQMADTFEGQATAKAETFQGKMDRLKLVFSETKEAIGAKLLPMLSSMGDWFLNKGIPAISKTWSWLSEKLGPVFARVGGWVRDNVMPPLRDLGDTLRGQLPAAWDAVQGAIKDAQPFFEIVGKIITNVLIPVFKKLAENILPAAAAQMKGVGKVFGAIGTIFKWTWNNVMQPVFKFLVLAIAKVLDIFGDMLSAMSHIPGFGWAKDAADKLHHAADETRGFANALKKIPPKKSVEVHTTFTYSGLRAPGGSGPTRGHGDDYGLPKGGASGKQLVMGGGASPRMAAKGATDWTTGTGGGGGVTIVVQGMLIGDDRKLARELERILRAGQRLSGRQILVGT